MTALIVSLIRHGLPYGTLGLRSRTRYNPSWSRGASTVAEVHLIAPDCTRVHLIAPDCTRYNPS